MTYTYDAAGNLITATDASGITTLTYNSADQLTSVTYPDGLSLAVHLQRRRPAHPDGREFGLAR